MGQCSRGGLGSHKHGVSGKSQKSPRLRFLMRLDAERSMRVCKKRTCIFSSINDLMSHRRDI